MEPFYGKEIDPDSEREIIEKILSKHRHKQASEELKKIIYSELMAAKESGLIAIPFKVVMREEILGHHRPYIEIILDTKT